LGRRGIAKTFSLRFQPGRWRGARGGRAGGAERVACERGVICRRRSARLQGREGRRENGGSSGSSVALYGGVPGKLPFSASSKSPRAQLNPCTMPLALLALAAAAAANLAAPELTISEDSGRILMISAREHRVYSRCASTVPTLARWKCGRRPSALCAATQPSHSEAHTSSRPHVQVGQDQPSSALALRPSDGGRGAGARAPAASERACSHARPRRRRDPGRHSVPPGRGRSGCHGRRGLPGGGPPRGSAILPCDVLGRVHTLAWPANP